MKLRPMYPSDEGLEELKTSEAYRKYAYPDPYSELARAYPKANWGFAPAKDILANLPASAANLSGKPWTVGYGEATGITMYDYRSEPEASEQLREKSKRYSEVVLRHLTIQPTQGQFDAMLAICWNVESALGASSSIVKHHNNKDWKAAAEAFKLYDKVTINGVKQVSQGLVKRRARESEMYLKGSLL